MTSVIELPRVARRDSCVVALHCSLGSGRQWGKLAAALAWIEDFLASGEPLVVFARHQEVQKAVVQRFPDALHLLGQDSLAAREESIAAFQRASPATASRRCRKREATAGAPPTFAAWLRMTS